MSERTRRPKDPAGARPSAAAGVPLASKLAESVDSILDVPGIRVGHYTDSVAATGCTVVLCEAGATGGVDVRGSAPGTRETDLLRPGNLVERVHAVLLTGGSAFGLDAASGVMRYLEERGIGYDVGVARVPIVPAAVLFDLAIGSAKTRPDAPAGYAACQSTLVAGAVWGSVGAGTGATVAKIGGPAGVIKGGIGSAATTLANGIIVGAVIAVNALGDIVDPSTGRNLTNRAAAIPDRGEAKSNSDAGRLSGLVSPTTTEPAVGKMDIGNTTIGVVATNAALSKEATNKVAQMAQDGLARAISPAHTMFDGDTIFALATGQNSASDSATLTTSPAEVSAIGAAAAEVVATAIIRALRAATSLAGVRALADLEGLG